MDSENKNSSSKSNMLTPGKILAHYREKRGYSLEQIAEATKIPLDQLKAIESDNYGDEDTQVFLRGFIKNYSDYLKLDTEKVLAIYRRTLATKNDSSKKTAKSVLKKKPAKSSPQVDSGKQKNERSTSPLKQSKSSSRKIFKNRKKFAITPQAVITTLVAVLVMVVISYIVIQYNKFRNPPELAVTAPENNLTVQDDTIDVVGTTDPGSTVEINGTPIKIDPEGKFQAKIKLAQGPNALIIKSYKDNNEDRASVVTRTVIYEVTESVEEEPAKDNGDSTGDQEQNEDSQQSDNNDSQEEYEAELIIETEETWIKLVTDEEQLIGSAVSPGEFGPYTFKETLEVVSGKPKNTTLRVGEETIELIANPETGVARTYCTVQSGELNCN